MPNGIPVPSLPSPPVIQVRGGLEEAFAPIVEALRFSAQRKMRQAEQAVSAFEEGLTNTAASPEQKKAYRTATGVDPDKLPPGSALRPLTGEAAEINRLMASLGIAPTSSLGQAFAATRAARVAGGQARGLITTPGLVAEAAGATALARGAATQAGEFERATAKMAAGTVSPKAVPGQPGALSESELNALQRFNNFVPGQAVADQLSGQTKAEVMKQALRIASDPESATWAGLLPAGLTNADLIGGFALGVGSALQSGLERIAVTEANAATEAARAIFNVAEAVSKQIGGAFSPAFIARIMSGDEKLTATPAGAYVRRALDAGFQAGMMELTAKGDPAFATIPRLLELGRISQIASNPKTLAQYSEAIQRSLADGYTRTRLGYDRLDVPDGSPEQRAWDAFSESVLKQTVGVFSDPGFWHEGIRVTPFPGRGREGAAAPGQQEQDFRVTEDALRAIFGPDTLSQFSRGRAPGGLFEPFQRR